MILGRDIPEGEISKDRGPRLGNRHVPSRKAGSPVWPEQGERRRERRDAMGADPTGILF